MSLTRYTMNEPDGTPFQELVVFPTLAPQLARPQNTPTFGGIDENLPIVPEHTFYLTAVLHYREASTGQGAKSKPKKASETKGGPAIPLFSMSRCDLLQDVLKLHDLHQLFRPSVISGFPVEISWPGSPGGKTNAPTIRDDNEFKTILDQLYQKRTVKNILISFDVDHLEPFRICSATVLDPRLAPWSTNIPEIRMGTQVPRPDGFGSADQLHGSIIMDLREEWKCAEHDTGACYRKDSAHFPLNRWKTKTWAAAIAANEPGVTMRDPPSTLFRVDDALTSRVIKSCGRSGPHSTHQHTASDSAIEAGTIMSAFFTSLLQQNHLMAPLTPACKHHISPMSSPAGPPDLSSPISIPEDNLPIVLEAFGHAKSIPEEAIDLAVAGLTEKRYTADTLSFAGVQRLAEITQFAEGDAAQLIKISKEWMGKVERKQARLAVPGSSRH
ncbi:hypothetical protein BJ912DRAFT_1057368 [Pholiota molesta]|nr:hypothetical protein BJ912DRAFT_1057368 [Pholiota molesta]